MSPGGEKVVAYLGFMRMRILEELAFLNGSTLLGALHSGGGGSHVAGTSATPLRVYACVCAMPGKYVQGCRLPPSLSHHPGGGGQGGGGGGGRLLRLFSVTGVLATDFTEEQLHRLDFESGGCQAWLAAVPNAGDMTLVEDLIAAAAELAHQRCSRICAQLCESSPQMAQLPGLEPQVPPSDFEAPRSKSMLI